MGPLSRLKPYNTIFISLSKAQSLSHTEQTLSSVTYYLTKEDTSEYFIKRAQKTPLDWNQLQLTSNDAQYNACVSIFENIYDKVKTFPFILLITGSFLLILVYIRLSKKQNLLKTFIVFIVALSITFFTSPYFSKYIINTSLSHRDMTISQKEIRKIRTVYTSKILIETIGIASIMYLETVIITYKKKISA